MFIYVFNEKDRDRLLAGGFVMIGKNGDVRGTDAWVFAFDGEKDIPEGTETMVSSKMSFGAIKENTGSGGGRHGK